MPCFNIRVIAISQPRLPAIATRMMQHSDACITTSPKLFNPKSHFELGLSMGQTAERELSWCVRIKIGVGSQIDGLTKEAEAKLGKRATSTM